MGTKSNSVLPIEGLTISRFNPRQTRPQTDVERLAARIKQNGFEITRALWVDGRREVFAGTTRFLASQMAGLTEVPVVLHEGYTDEEIVRLAEQDNENDEYHRAVPLVDEWLHYKALHALGWTQQRIAEAKGVSQYVVSTRISYAQLPQSILARFIGSELLKESHAAEISQLLDFNNLAPWLTRETAMLEVIDKTLDAFRGKNGGGCPTAKQFAGNVAYFNSFMMLADDCYQRLLVQYQGLFLQQLSVESARGTAKVQEIYNAVLRRKEADEQTAADALAAQQQRLGAEREQTSLEMKRVAQFETTMRNVICGDAREMIGQFPSGFKLLLTDPPYGQEWQSNRRVAKAKTRPISNDDAQHSLTLLAAVLTGAYPRMAEDSAVLVWCSWQSEPAFREVVISAGFVIKSSLVWAKPNHGLGDLEGSFAPAHERIIYAVKGSPVLRQRLSDVLPGSEFLGTGHPAEKPIDLLRELITATTAEQEWVVDPFAGTGSAVLAAHDTQRQCFACEIDPDYHRTLSDLLYARLENA